MTNSTPTIGYPATFTKDDIKVLNQIDEAYYNAILYCKEHNLIQEPVRLLVYNLDVVCMAHGTAKHLDPSPLISYGLSTPLYNWYISTHQILASMVRTQSPRISCHAFTPNSTTWSVYLDLLVQHDDKPEDTTKLNRILSFFHPIPTHALLDYDPNNTWFDWFIPRFTNYVGYLCQSTASAPDIDIEKLSMQLNPDPQSSDTESIADIPYLVDNTKENSRLKFQLYSLLLTLKNQTQALYLCKSPKQFNQIQANRPALVQLIFDLLGLPISTSTINKITSVYRRH